MARYKVKRFSDGTVIAIDTSNGNVMYGVPTSWVKAKSADELLSLMTTPVTIQESEESVAGALKSLPSNIKGYSLQFYGTGGMFGGVAVEDGKIVEDQSYGGYVNTLTYTVPNSASVIDGTTRVMIILKL